MQSPANIWSFPRLTERASTTAWHVDLVFIGFLIFSVAITALIGIMILYFCIKYRAGSRADRSRPIEHLSRYEFVWIAALTVIALGMFVWAAVAFYEVTVPPAGARTVYVVGRQWMWKAEHPAGPEGGRRELDELTVPVGQPVRLLLTSQDVIHSFFVPAFRNKMDVLPDRYTTMWFRADRPGRYHLFCAEYCGTDHSIMRGDIRVLDEADYERWLSAAPLEEAPIPGTPGTPSAPLAVAGRGAFFQFGCNACHVPTSTVRAPRLDGIFGNETRLANGDRLIVDEQYIRESILDPNARIVAGYAAPSLMPTYQGQLTVDQLNELVEFIRSIRYGWPQDITMPEEPAGPQSPPGGPAAPIPTRPRSQPR